MSLNFHCELSKTLCVCTSACVCICSCMYVSNFCLFTLKQLTHYHSTDITKPILKWIDVISHYQPEVCKILEHSDESLLSLANNLFEKGIIDDMTKNEVDRQKGYDGADTMIEYVKMKIKQTPALCQTFLQVMEKLVVLEDVVEHIKNKSGKKYMYYEFVI